MVTQLYGHLLLYHGQAVMTGPALQYPWFVKKSKKYRQNDKLMLPLYRKVDWRGKKHKSSTRPWVYTGSGAVIFFCYQVPDGLETGGWFMVNSMCTIWRSVQTILWLSETCVYIIWRLQTAYGHKRVIHQTLLLTDHSPRFEQYAITTSPVYRHTLLDCLWIIPQLCSTWWNQCSHHQGLRWHPL